LSSSLAPYGDQVKEVLRLASRRKLLVEAAEQFALALDIVLSGLITMLLLGTALLSWKWMTLLTVAGLLIFALRLRTRLVSPYRVAQIVDQRLSLHDALSTAHFLLSSSAADGSPAARVQLEQTSRAVATARIEDAFPFKAKRAWAVCGALVAVGFGLFAIRYLVTQSLSLRPSLITFQMPLVLERWQDSLRPKRDDLKTPPSLRRYAASPTAANRNETADNRNLPTEATEPAGNSDRNGELTKGQQTQNAPNGDKQGQNSSSEGRAGNQTSSQGESSPKTEERSSPQGAPPNASTDKEQATNSQSNSPGLVSRMKSAFSNMMAKMRANGAPQQPGQQNSSEDGQNEAKNNQNNAGANAAQKSGQGSNGEKARNDQSSENSNAEGQAQGQTAERPQNAQASSGQSAQKGSDAQSGVGRQDGDKAIKDAEQLQAMGKLAELIGKRSANLTGDMTVETPSGKQQLKTAYSQQTGHHSDAGGEINRNEIPMMYQQYVREYMEQVNKQREKSKP
jgi:hypothetical protein